MRVHDLQHNRHVVSNNAKLASVVLVLSNSIQHPCNARFANMGVWTASVARARAKLHPAPNELQSARMLSGDTVYPNELC